MSLRIIFGPDTDVKRLQTTIANIVRSGEQADCSTFYKKNGDDVKFPFRGYSTTFDGHEACRLSIDESELAAGNDLPSASKSEMRTEPSNSKYSTVVPICAGTDEQQCWNSSSSAVPVTSEVDRAVLLHMNAVRKAAASKGSAK